MARPKTAPAYRRRIYFIEKKFQAKFILKFCVLVAIAGIGTMVILYLLTMRSSTVSVVDSRIVVKTTASFLLPLLVQTILAVTVITSLAAIFVTLFISHKLAGPMYRFKKVMDDLAKGDFSNDFRLRQYDQLQDLAGAFNTMILRTREKLHELDSEIGIVKKELEEINAKEVPDEARSKLNELKGTYSKLEKTMRYFKI